MAELDQQKQIITSNIKELQDLINRSPLFSNDHKKWKANITKLMAQTRNHIRLLQDGTNDLQDIQRPAYINAVRSYVKNMKKLQSDINKRQRGQSYTANQNSPAPIIQTEQQKRINAQQAYMFSKGDQAIQTTMGAVQQMRGMTEKGIELVNQTNRMLAQQIQQLDRMHARTQDTKSSLKKAQKNITYFVKALQCDKCMVGLLGLILLALIAVIVLAIKKSNQ